MRSSAPSLRYTLLWSTAVVVFVVLLVSGALILLTGALQRASSALVDAIESVRQAEESEIDLLLHGRANDPEVRETLERNLRRRVGELTRYISTQEEGEAVQEAQQKVQHYLQLYDAPGRQAEELTFALDSAYAALEAVVQINISQSQTVRDQARRWTRLGNLLGGVTGGLVLLVALGFTWWLKRKAFRPVLELADSIERFARGDRTVRAVVQGPLELREMSRRFNDMAFALAKQREAQARFLAGVAHDLKNPLAALRLSVAVVQPDQPLPDERRVRRALEVVQRQVTRLERMVGDFLDVAQIEAGRVELQFERHDARRLVREVVDLFEISQPPQRIVVSLPQSEVPLICDALRVEQVLSNLISNAIKYSPDAETIEIRLSASETWADFSVIDHGRGISPEDQARLFEPFSRVGLSKDDVPGVGLGLFVVRQLVEAHGGRIAVRSEVGVGSTFRVSLPRRMAASLSELSPDAR